VVPIGRDLSRRTRARRSFTVRAIAAGASLGIPKQELALIAQRT
jgi:hypothetical protein